MLVRKILSLLCLINLLTIGNVRADSISDNPILFVTMIPNPRDFGTLAATFGNHVANPDTAFRGGDLYIRYPNGTLKNLTQTAGYGNAGFQGSQSIAVRDPSVHWDGQKALFSMVVGAPTQQYQVNSYRWQIYEITGLGPSDTPVITKVPNQPVLYNNVSPIYASDDKILFTSDHPRDSSVAHTYPQRDEYESSPTNTGIWKLNPQNGDLELLDHAPSGDFTPIIDSFGRIIFTRWDHLQRDQQNVGVDFGAFNFASEESKQSIGSAPEFFPEPRSAADPDYVSTTNLHTLNQFFPWMMNQDGTDLETLNHIGRQEVGLYSERSFNDDPNVQEFYGQYSTGSNTNEFTLFLHIKESPTEAGRYYGISCPEFATHSAGQIISINGSPNVNANDMQVSYHTHPDTAGPSNNPGPNHSGLYRDPLPLSNGNLIAAHTAETREDSNIGSSTAPLSRYAFRLKFLSTSGLYLAANTAVTSGITKSINFWDPDKLVSYNGELWEVMPVEVKATTRPTAHSSVLPNIESKVLEDAGVSLADLQSYLKANKLALIVGRDLTSRDKNDRQQPTNIRVTGTSTEAIPKNGKVYDISHFQIFQGDLIRGYTNTSSGRRVLAKPMHSVGEGVNLQREGAPQGAVEIADDGSIAAFVPAGRALTWQMSDQSGAPVVRERYWLTMQHGEIRVCGSCHGVNQQDHIGRGQPQNSPLALARLMANFKNLPLPTPPAGTPKGKFKMQVQGMPHIKTGSKFKVTVSGGAQSDSLVLAAKINKYQCARTFAIKTGSKNRDIKGRFPKKLSTTVTFAARGAGSQTNLASKKVKVASNKKIKKKATSEQACAAMFASLKN